MPTLEEADYEARCFTRAVLVYSGRDRALIVLDRSLDSLAGVRRYVAETGSTSSALISYLVMLAFETRGRDTDIHALEPWGVPLDEFERRLRAAPTRGEPWPRTTVMALHMKTSKKLDGKTTFGRVMVAIEDRVDQTQNVVEPEDPGEEGATWSWIVDSEELRIDASVGEVVVTLPIRETNPDLLSAYLAKELTRYVRVLDVRAAYAFPIDQPAYWQYLRGGFSAGLPMWVFTFDGATLSVLEGTIENTRKLS
jgi:hypothetical protein